MATHVATCHGGRVENEVPESRIDSLPCEEDGDADQGLVDDLRVLGLQSVCHDAPEDNEVHRHGS